MKPKSMISVGDSKHVHELVRNAPILESILANLDDYLNNGDLDFTRERRAMHVRYILDEIVQEGRVRGGSRAYERINRFYKERFGVDAPSYKDGIILSRENEDAALNFQGIY